MEVLAIALISALLNLSICIFSFIILNKTKIHPLFLILGFGVAGYFLEL